MGVNRMFKIGDLIIYAGHGICKIDDIREQTFRGLTKPCYILHPLENNPQLTISTPTDNDKVVMLELIQKEEAYEILESFKYPGIEWNDNKNERSRTYSNVVKKGDRNEIAKLVNTLMRKKLEADLQERKLYEHDYELLNTSKNTLFQELAISTDTTFEEINERVISLIRAT